MADRWGCSSGGPGLSTPAMRMARPPTRLRRSSTSLGSPRGEGSSGRDRGSASCSTTPPTRPIIEDDLVKARWEAIVDRITWDAVRARREADPRRMHNLGTTKPHKPYLLSGLMWCGQCGRKMTHTRCRRATRGACTTAPARAGHSGTDVSMRGSTATLPRSTWRIASWSGARSRS
jgi:hypothetical protein